MTNTKFTMRRKKHWIELIGLEPIIGIFCTGYLGLGMILMELGATPGRLLTYLFSVMIAGIILTNFNK